MDGSSYLKKMKLNYHRLRIRLLSAIFKHFPKLRAEILFFNYFKRRINWKHPTDLIEKIRWLQFNTDISLWTYLADKCSARNYVETKGLTGILIPTYGIWENPDDINFTDLPKTFVIKPNNGSGDAIIVHDKNLCDIAAIKKKLRHSMRTIYGQNNAETHYSNIRPVIIAEKLLASNFDFSSSMVDFKFFCADGEPVLCLVYYNRVDMESHEMEYAAYDMDWNKHDEWLTSNNRFRSADIPKPDKLDECINYCRILSQNIPFVRIDLYISDGKVYFGEFTFTPNALKPVNLSQMGRDMIASRISI